MSFVLGPSTLMGVETFDVLEERHKWHRQLKAVETAMEGDKGGGFAVGVLSP